MTTYKATFGTFIERRFDSLLNKAFQAQDVGNGGFQALQDAEIIWERNRLDLLPIMPASISKIIRIVLHENATQGTDDQVRYLVSPVTDAMPVETRPGMFGNRDAKLLAYHGIRFLSAVAEIHPQVFTSDHVDKMLTIAKAAEADLLCTYGDRNIYEGLADVARHDATLFSRADVRDIFNNQSTGCVHVVGPEYRFPYRPIYSALGMSKNPSFMQHKPLDYKQLPSREATIKAIMTKSRL